VTPTRPKATRKKSIEAEIDDGVWAERYQDLEKYWKRSVPTPGRMSHVACRCEEISDLTLCVFCRFGHSKVPKKWDEDPGLGTWVAQMRERKRAVPLLLPFSELVPRPW
jgi:hypothetical protein